MNENRDYGLYRKATTFITNRMEILEKVTNYEDRKRILEEIAVMSHVARAAK
jgi:pyoverdine/dityrosine biosynthesis protein Dit1